MNWRSDGSGRKGRPHEPFAGYKMSALPIELPATAPTVASSLIHLAGFKETDPAALLLLNLAFGNGARELPRRSAAIISFGKKVLPAEAERMMRGSRFAQPGVEELVQFRLAIQMGSLPWGFFHEFAEAGVLALGSTLPLPLGFRAVPLIAGLEGEFLMATQFENWMSAKCGFLAIPMV